MSQKINKKDCNFEHGLCGFAQSPTLAFVDKRTAAMAPKAQRWMVDVLDCQVSGGFISLWMK